MTRGDADSRLGSADRRLGPAERAELSLLVVVGFVFGILTTLFLNLYIGSVPIPVTALVAGLGNAFLLRLASAYTDSTAKYGPLIAWAFVAVVAIVPGLFGNQALLSDWRILLHLGLGLGIPAIMASADNVARASQR